MQLVVRKTIAILEAIRLLSTVRKMLQGTAYGSQLRHY